MRGSTTSGTKPRARAGQARSTAARPSTAISLAAPSEPEHSEARIAIMTLAGNSLSFGDVRKACKRCADEFLRDPKENDARGPHTVCVSQAKEASLTAKEQGGDTDVETALAALAEESDIDLEETDVQEILLAF